MNINKTHPRYQLKIIRRKIILAFTQNIYKVILRQIMLPNPLYMLPSKELIIHIQEKKDISKKLIIE